MASHDRSANAWSSSRFMSGALPRWATTGTGDSRRRQGDWTCSSANRQSMPSSSHTVRGFSGRASPITRKVAPASRAASIKPLE